MAAKVVLIPQDIAGAGKEFLRERGYEVRVGGGLEGDALRSAIGEADGVIFRTEPYTREVLAAGAGRLKILSRYGVGYENVDLAAARDLGIVVTIAQGANAVSVAEHALALMLACVKQLPASQRAIREGDWAARNALRCFELRGKVLGLVGLGAIGREFSKMAHFGLGMRVTAYDPFLAADAFPEHVARCGSVEALAADCDVLSLHLPGGAQNRGLVGRSLLSRMRPHAVVINCARGGIVDEDALYQALRDGTIAAAGLDVFSAEPPDPSHPLHSLEQVICTPHSASLTPQALENMSLIAARQVDDVLCGRPALHPVGQ